MRIAQVTPLYHPYIGGVEMVVQNISEKMVEEGHQVDVITVDLGGKCQAREVINGVQVYRFPRTGPFYYARGIADHLLSNSTNYQLVHAHNLHTFIPHLTVNTLKQSKTCPIVVSGHYHGRGSSLITNQLLRLYRPFIKKFLSLVEGVFCVSNYEAELITRHFNIAGDLIHVIPNGVPVKAIARAKGHQKPGKILLAVSRLEKYKNIQLAIRSMPYLPLDYSLVIIGDGPYRQHLIRLARSLKLNGRVQFLGRLPNEEVYQWYATSDLVLNLSNLEAFGLTVLEGLAAGKPVLVNRRTALAELAQRLDGVTAVDAGNIDPLSLAEAIYRRTTTPFKITSLADYEWRVIAEKMVGFYAALRN